MTVDSSDRDLPRVPLGPMQNPARGFLHGSAALASAVGLGFLLARAEGALAVVGAVVFGLGLVGLYTTSSLYHSVPWPTEWKLRMQRLDHSMIFVLIAATYTPMILLTFGGGWRLALLGVVWGIAGIGIANRLFSAMERHGFSFGLMVLLGWLSVPIIAPVAQRLGLAMIALIALGGVLYTVGMVFKVTRWPRLWPRVFSAHELFHVFVVLASVVHWAAIYRYVLAPAA